MAVGRDHGGGAWRKPLQAVTVAIALGCSLALSTLAQDQPLPPTEAAQAAQPDPAAQLSPTPATPPSRPVAVAEFPVGAPHLQAIAQGLVTIDGPVVWRVREITLTPAGLQEYYPASFILQRSGVGIVRNDLTSHRTRIESGEAAFLQNGEPYSPLASGADPSVGWVIELMPQAASAALGSGVTLLASDAIADYPAGIYDLELQRAILLPGEVSELPPHTGPALVMIAAGRVQVSAIGEAPLPAAAGDGLLAPGSLTIRNGDAQPAAFIVAMLGDRVDGAEAAVAGDGGFGPAAPTQPPLMQTPVPVPPTQPPLTNGQAVPPPVDQQFPPTPPPAVAPTAPPAGQADSDGDGVTDEIELQMGTDPYNQDYDGDGLSEGEEIYTYGTDPTNNDTDNDGLLDGEEATSFGTNPVSLDSDGDSAADADEIYVYGTEPMTWDTDGDGISDGDEVNFLGTDPLDPTSGP